MSVIYYSIGEFAQKTGTTIRTLRYYDEIGLLSPKKHPHSGRRMYTDDDVLILQKIVSLKFLGYSLEQIHQLLNQTRLDLSLRETLEMQRRLFEEKRKSIEQAIKAMDRILFLLREEKEVDNEVIMSLIHSLQTENEQRRWLEQYLPQSLIDSLFHKSEADMMAMDREWVRLTKKAKQLAGTPVDHPEVEALMEQYMNATLTFVGPDTMQMLGRLEQVEEMVREAETCNWMPSPFTKEEEQWLHQAMEHYMVKKGLIE
ncbi:MerR family transcriptional regulator [Geobacillus sp. C56-T2]|nr:MerR family transcriptional regulator [Geobacillus sp. C56-T2]NNV08093.1 MerR family transcriptional regulator [Geobacillus sp. MMMUD3]TWG30546.1 DNA-binding transcriptional MerR regulator [Geobacillus sp. C56-T2]